ncbi:MAG: glycosyltransferase family 4 protein [Oscillatoriophycideae cyanobacterium NC_groundwater_1537_Pr4_S-0.65um_50_18]|nr:glycosyltransferase family 4 protein [Oscillatoriophycideae cyanobacterium NC_groundwater_1537_Pr4_S-0.65um_50_18]
MHLIVLENEPSSYRGGQELSLIDICQGLHRRGHRISLLYKKSGDLLQHYQSFCSDITCVDEYKLKAKNLLRFVSSLHQTAQAITTESQSLVYCNQYQESFFGYGLACLKAIPFVCHLRLPPPTTLGIQSRLGLWGAKQLIAISQQTQQDWIAAGFSHQKFNTVYNGIDLEKSQEKIQPHTTSAIAQTQPPILTSPMTAPVIAYVGRLDKVKGVETLLKAIALLKLEEPHLHLLIAGKPLIQNARYQDFLIQLAHQLGIESNVSFLGHVSSPTKIYHASHVAVLPSLWPEPFGRTILEAMACGVPVVASQVGGIPEVLSGEFAQGLFQPGNAEDLAAKIRHTLNWQSQDINLRQRCRDHVGDRFPLTKTVEGVEQVMFKALGC